MAKGKFPCIVCGRAVPKEFAFARLCPRHLPRHLLRSQKHLAEHDRGVKELAAARKDTRIGERLLAGEPGVKRRVKRRTKRNSLHDERVTESREAQEHNRRQRTRRNPPPMYGSRTRKVGAKNMIGLHVYEIRYQHAADGKDYKHPFDTGVVMWGMPDGSIWLESATGARLWENRDA